MFYLSQLKDLRDCCVSNTLSVKHGKGEPSYASFYFLIYLYTDSTCSKVLLVFHRHPDFRDFSSKGMHHFLAVEHRTDHIGIHIDCAVQVESRY